MVEKLKVPKVWVYQAKALRASQEEWYDLKALHLLSAGLWNSAHDTIMEHLAVDAIINGELEFVWLLQTVLASITSFSFECDTCR